MTIPEAIQQAKEEYNWSITPHEPTTVRVDYSNMRDGKIHYVELDFYGDRPEEELAQLWADLCSELDSSTDGVDSVEAYGHILE